MGPPKLTESHQMSRQMLILREVLFVTDIVCKVHSQHMMHSMLSLEGHAVHNPGQIIMASVMPESIWLKYINKDIL